MQIASEVETGLEQRCPSRWLRLTDDELQKAKVAGFFVMGWRVDVTNEALQIAGVDHLILAIDDTFPNSQPRVLAPSVGNTYCWPHVEPQGLLCLRSSRLSAPIAERVAFHLNDAVELLKFSETRRREEFEREFSTYWFHRATQGSVSPKVLSLVTPGGSARAVYSFFDAKNQQFVVADDKATLVSWLHNIGRNLGNSEISMAHLFCLSRPWRPDEFPEYGNDITKLLLPEIAQRCLNPGMPSLFLFEAQTITGPAFVAVVLLGPERKDILKGFRHISKVPLQRIIDSYAKRPVVRCNVSRIDGTWIHGRGRPSSYDAVKKRKVVIIGCGAIGSALAYLLAQAGVRETVLVDDDSLASANVSRHTLGINHIGLNKANSLQTSLQRQFPHLTFEHAFAKRFERLNDKELGRLADADLIIAAGIDFDGESALDAWRRTLSRPPAYLSTWAEAYAVVGHAVLLYGKMSILDGFDDQELPRYRLTDWPDEAGALVVEAGCGNSFQPHSVVDLHPIIGLAAGLALDTLLDKIPSSSRRVWMGNPDLVKPKGGILLPTFTDRLAIREYVWP